MMDGRAGLKAAARVCSALALTFGFALLLSVQFDFYYDLNDDTMIKDILSGAYTGTPDGRCIQMLYPLGWCLALFYRVFPNVAWFGLFLCLCQFGVIFLVTSRLFLMAGSVRGAIAAAIIELLFMAGLFLRELVIMQYSVAAGICMAGAAFLFVTAPKDCRPPVFFSRNLPPLFLVLLAFMIRTEVCLMLMPFLIIAGMSMWLGEEKVFTAANFKKYFMLAVTLALCMTVAYSLDMLAYKGSEWGSFRSFFDARTKLYDFYGLPPYEEHVEFYESIGLSGESYALLENYNFALDNSIDAWRLDAIAGYQEGLAGNPGGTGLKNTFGIISRNSAGEALRLYKNQIISDFSGGFSSRAAAGIAVMAAYMFYILTCIVPARGKRRFVAALALAALLAARSVLWLYLYMADRLPSRVTMPLLLMELAVLAGFGAGSGKICIGGAKKKSAIACAVYAAIMLVILAANLRAVRGEYAMRAEADARWGSLTDYCRKNGNNYYIIDVYSSTSYNGAPYSEKMFTRGGFGADNSYKNFDVCGGWAAKSPLARQKLERARLKDIRGALVGAKGGKGTKAYFIAGVDKELGWLVEYYKMRGVSAEPERAGVIRTPSGEEAFGVYGLKTHAG